MIRSRRFEPTGMTKTQIRLLIENMDEAENLEQYDSIQDLLRWNNDLVIAETPI